MSDHSRSKVTAVDGGDWSEAECMLALWAYSVLDRNREIVKSDIYREVSALTGRKESAVRIKLNNVAECDPREPSEKPVPVWEKRQNLLAEMFSQYGRDYEALDNYHRDFKYLQEFNTTFNPITSSGQHISYITEGGIVEGFSSKRKRSATLIKKARSHFRAMSPDGRLCCVVCGWSSDGIIDGEIIHIHHLEPISESDVATIKKLNEAIAKVAPVCPTCHSIIHSRAPIMSIEEAVQIRSGNISN